MTIATRTTTTLEPTVNQAALVTAIKTAFSNTSLTLFHEFTNGSNEVILVYEHVVNASQTMGKIYYRIRVTTTLVIGHRIYTSWNTGTQDGANPGTEANFTALASGTLITFNAFNSDEAKLLIITQGSSYIPLGLLIPSNRPSWWNLNAWAFGFHFTNNTTNVLRGVAAAALPYASSDFDTNLNNTRMGNVNPQTLLPDLISPIILLTQSNQGVCCASSGLASGCFSGQTRFATVSPVGSGQTFTIINSVSGGLAIRTG